MILTGLIGWPVAHSKSPAMHNAAFRSAGIDGFYGLLPVRPHRVGEAIAGLRALGFRGANVTVPHKQAVIPFLDEITPVAQAIGAVNTILIDDDGHMVGTNTDAWGFIRDLEAIGMPFESIRDKGALVLGAGGSARAVAYALATHNISTHILARRPEQARALVQSLIPHLPHKDLIRAYDWSHLSKLAPIVKLIVNCTPVGMSPDIEDSPWPDHLGFRPDQLVYDLVYNPSRTRLMAQAEAAGARAWNGVGMLVHQGAKAWELWTGHSAPVDVMRAAVLAP